MKPGEAGCEVKKVCELVALGLVWLLTVSKAARVFKPILSCKTKGLRTAPDILLAKRKATLGESRLEVMTVQVNCSQLHNTKLWIGDLVSFVCRWTNNNHSNCMNQSANRNIAVSQREQEACRELFKLSVFYWIFILTSRRIFGDRHNFNLAVRLTPDQVFPGNRVPSLRAKSCCHVNQSKSTQHEIPHVHVTQKASEGLLCVERPCKRVLILANNHHTSPFDNGSTFKFCFCPFQGPIYVKIKLSLSIRPRDTHVMPVFVQKRTGPQVPKIQEYHKVLIWHRHGNMPFSFIFRFPLMIKKKPC